MRKKKQELKHIVLKLITGDDVIGVLLEGSGKSYILEQPFYVVTYVTETGLAAVYLKRYTTLANEHKIIIPADQVISTYDPNQHFVEYYTVTSDFYQNISDEYLITTVKTVTSSIKASMKKHLDKQSLDMYAEDWMDSLKYVKSPGIKH